MAAVQLGCAQREVRARVGAAALLPGEGAGGDEPRERVLVVEQASQPVGVRSRPASRHIAARASYDGAGAASTAGGVRLARRRGAGSSSAASAARRPNTKHSDSELEARRFAPCRPVHAHSPTA